MEDLFEKTQTVAYFLWEYTKHENALSLWYCAEDIAFYAERHNITSVSDIQELKARGRYDYGYLEFIRNIAYRIYLFTGNPDSKQNWFKTEALLNNMEWCKALIDVVTIFGAIHRKEISGDGIRSDKIRRYYSE